MGKQNEIIGQAVELSATDGVAFIEQASPLTRLHYFDGKFLRADAFALEQDYHRMATRLANLAGGWGVVHGLGISLSGNQLGVGAGLAITAAGNFVLASGDMQASLEDLLARAAATPPEGSKAFADCLEKAPPGVKETAALAIYEITVGPVEGLCGNEAVYGKLCESACATDSRHPYWREGVVLRLRPVTLQLPSSSSITPAVVHLRNRVASAYFRAEPWLTPSALSGAGLASGVWCQPATLYGRDEVAIGLLAREGGVNRVIDAWSGRRERMDAQARGYWQGRMAMRPWNVFVAQILQFQCQLSGLFEGGSTVIQPGDNCDDLRQLLDKTRKELDALVARYGQSSKKILFKVEGKPTTKELQLAASSVASSFADIGGLSAQLAAAEVGKGALPKQRMLLNAGFFELPPAGYLPVDPQGPIEEQVQRMFGEGAKLHYHAVRHDEIAHLVEEAQHMERISLTRGLDDPAKVEQVEIFVPDGEVRDAQALATGTWWRVEMLSSALSALLRVAPSTIKPGAEHPTPVPKPVGEVEEMAAATHKSASTAKRAAAARATVEEVAVQAGASTHHVTVSTRMPVLDGLTRTESRDDKSHGLTLVAAADSANPTTDFDDAKMITRMDAASTASRMAIYVAADVDRDPFGLAVGGEVALKAEIRSMMSRDAAEIHFGGTLTVLARRTLASGREERLVQLSAQLTESTPGKPAEHTATRMRLLLQRGGDAATGVFIIDDEKQDASSSPVFFEWDDAPRRAVMFVQAQDAAEVFRQRMSSLRGGVKATAFESAPASVDTASHAPPAPPEVSAARAAHPTRQQLVSMVGLAAMPEPTSNVGAAALNTLVAIADATDDAAFLLRARQRLLPTLDAPKTQTVRAVDDWLMFRRARTHLCGPACAAVPAVGLETFQVWHLLADEKQLPVLAAALDRGDEKTLAGFDFKRVGVLRYRDESAFAEESADRVLAMWAAAQPAAKVALGRVWETAPATGQGWQNHFRLRNMIEQIASLTAPPARGDGALAAIAVPSSRLNDGALDGGMLVVTSGAAVHRNALLIYGGKRDGDLHFLEPGLPQSPMQFDDDAPVGNALADFIAGLKADLPVGGVTLTLPQGAPDDGAKRRLEAIVAALVEAGRPAPAAGRQKALPLNENDRAELMQIGVKPDDYGDIVFFEPDDRD